VWRSTAWSLAAAECLLGFHILGRSEAYLSSSMCATSQRQCGQVAGPLFEMTSDGTRVIWRASAEQAWWVPQFAKLAISQASNCPDPNVWRLNRHRCESGGRSGAPRLGFCRLHSGSGYCWLPESHGSVSNGKP